MLQKYFIYFSLKEECNVYFSSTYSTFNEAKHNIENFLKDYAHTRGKSVIYVTKEELEKVKVPEKAYYVRRKNSEAIVYNFETNIGRFYNTYTLTKYGKIGINEILFSKEEKEISVEKTVNLHVTNYERGAHVSFVSELKNVLSKRELTIILPQKKEVEKPENPFITSLKLGKTTLRNVTPIASPALGRVVPV
tara:strand:+ start:138 stop:716 length:579 start_codon:yes stop_codon:yes gene_type:complete